MGERWPSDGRVHGVTRLFHGGAMELDGKTVGPASAAINRLRKKSHNANQPRQIPGCRQ
jgi:hypothetical protein